MGLTLEEKVEKNKEWIEIAKECGLFNDGYDKKDITTSSDYVIIHWIDELEKSTLDKETFRNEVIPSFKRWFNNGVKTTGVGRLYNIISLCEIKIRKYGKNINPAWVETIINFFNKDIVAIPVLEEEIDEYFEVDKKLDTIMTFVRLGISYADFDRNFDVLEYLYNEGKKVDFNTALFFADIMPDSLNDSSRKFLNKKKLAFEHREFVGEEYGYYPYTAFEANTLMNMMSVGMDSPYGHNFQHVEILRRRIEKIKKGMAKRIFHPHQGNKKGKLVKITYYELSDGKEEEKNIIGRLIDFSDNRIVIQDIGGKRNELVNSDALHIFEIKGSLKTFDAFFQELKKLEEELRKIEIDSMVPNNGLGYPPYSQAVQKKERKEKEIEQLMKKFEHQIYRSKDLTNWRKVVEYNKKIAAIKSKNVVEEYSNRYGTLEGVAFLKTKDSLFFRMVHPKQFPIDNLFAACFECLAFDTDDKVKQDQILKRVWAAYEILSEKNLEWLKKCNYGGDLKHVLLDSTLEAVERVCRYVSSNQLEKELPPEPEGMGFNGMQALTLRQIEAGINKTKIRIDGLDARKRFLVVFNKILQLLPKELVEGLDEDLLIQLVGALIESLSEEEWMGIWEDKVDDKLIAILIARLSDMIKNLKQGNGKGMVSR